VHVAAAIQVRVVDQAFPADGGARLLDVGAHHQQQVLADVAGQSGEALGVVEHGLLVMQRARADHHQQARIAAVEDGTDGLTLLLDLLGEDGSERQSLA
jgi:cobaltochelatase CobN